MTAAGDPQPAGQSHLMDASVESRPAAPPDATQPPRSGPATSRPASFPRSLRVRLQLWYVGILAVVLCVFSLVLYRNVATSLSRSVDRVLLMQADSVASTIVAFWRAERSSASPGNWVDAPSATMRADLDNGRLLELLTRWAEKTHMLDAARPVHVLTSHGDTVHASAGFRQLGLPERILVAPEALRGRTVYDTHVLPEGRLRVITRPILEDGQGLYLVQVAAPLSQLEASLAQLRSWLMWLIPATLLITGAGGIWLATIALRPITMMVSQAQRIGAQRLDERLRVPATGDELERLATTFNDLLARLERAFRRLRQFSAAASHELRTPLTVMKGELEVALRKPREAEEYRRVLRTHLEMIDEMALTVEELLALGRSEAVDAAIEWRPVDVSAMAHQITDTLRTVADAKDVRIEAPSEHPVWVRGERRLLERLVVNLLDNAIKHTPPSGHVTIRADRSDGEVRLVVQDTGPGITAEELPHIFDRFFKRRTSSDAPQSTGLGLGLCRWIAEAHHGRIDVDSAPGCGAKFIVRLPGGDSSQAS